MSDLKREVDIVTDGLQEDIEAIEEMKDAEQTLPKDEKASVDSVKKASDNGSAKKRKGDKGDKDEPEGSKEKSFANKMWENSDVDFTDELNALSESEATLSGGFKEKAATIFEAAIQMKMNEEVSRLEEQYEERLEEAVEEISIDLTEKVNSYMNYVVENWMQENEVAIEQNIRSEVTESFMAALKDVFVEHYIEVPESKVDLVDALADQVADLEEQLNTTLEDNIKLNESLKAVSKEAVLKEAQKTLTIQQADKLAKLVEGIEASDIEVFTKKVATIKEAYFAETKTVVEDVEDGAVGSDAEALHESNLQVDGPMGRYMEAISRINKR